MAMKTNKLIINKKKPYADETKKRAEVLTIVLIMFMIFIAASEMLCPYDPNAQIFDTMQPPGAEHLAGTDRYGRDMLSRILVGLKTSVYSTLILVAVITVTGTAAGMICGYAGGVWDMILMRMSDICLAFPSLVFAMAISAILDGGIQNAVIALAVINWPKYARLSRSRTLSVMSSDYIAAARLAGDNAFQLLIRHVMPNIIGSVLVTSMLDIGTMMMELAGLSFLGLGAQPPTAELGSMMSGGRSMLQTYPWIILGPGIAIFIAVAIFNLYGDALRDYLDPGRKK
jgi:peptide/nickel transport system permease protein